MKRSSRPILIAARGSRLAVLQAEMVGRALQRLHPELEVSYRHLTSDGDRIQDRPLAAVGGKGLFTKVVDDAVLDGHCDVAVHSLKDVPADLPPGLQLVATPRRADPRDVLITRHDAAALADLPPSAVVGTSSPRRAAQVRTILPGARIELLRGNVQTRIAKVLDPEGSYDATLLAAAGLGRMGLLKDHPRLLEPDAMLPAASQGALGIVCRATDDLTLRRCLRLNHAATSTAVTAERELVHRLGADCHSPIAVLACPIDPPAAAGPITRNADAHWFRLRARVISADGRRVVDFDDHCKTDALRRLVKAAAKALEAGGAREILKAAREAPATPPGPPPGTT